MNFFLQIFVHFLFEKMLLMSSVPLLMGQIRRAYLEGGSFSGAFLAR